MKRRETRRDVLEHYLQYNIEPPLVSVQRPMLPPQLQLLRVSLQVGKNW